MTVEDAHAGGAVPDDFQSHPAAARAEAIQLQLTTKRPDMHIDEAVQDLERNSDTGKYVTPAYRFALEKLRAKLSTLNPYREAVLTTVQAIVNRETMELERQHKRQLELLAEEEAEIEFYMQNKEKALEDKRADDARTTTEVRRIENIYAGEMTKIRQEKQAFRSEVEFDIEEEQIKTDAEKDRLRREVTTEVDDAMHEFEAWKTKQLLGLQNQQAEIWESSSAAKEELATELAKLREKISFHETEIAKVMLDMSEAEAEVEKATAAMELCRAEAEDSLALADKASMAYRPQEDRLHELQKKRTEETNSRDTMWRAKERMIAGEEETRRAEAKERLNNATSEHQAMVKAKAEEIARLEERAQKETEIVERDLEACRVRVEEATDAALAARDMLKTKHEEMKGTEASAAQCLRDLEEQNRLDNLVTPESFANRRTEAEAHFVLEFERLKKEHEAVKARADETRVEEAAAAKDEATKSRVVLDGEYTVQEQRLKELYEKVGYARAQISDHQDLLNDATERHGKKTMARIKEKDMRQAAGRHTLEALWAEQAQAAAAAEEEANLVAQGVRARERAQDAAQTEEKARVEQEELLELCCVRAGELADRSRQDAADSASAAARTVSSASASIETAEAELHKLIEEVGKRGEMFASSMGLGESFSIMIKKVEEHLAADRAQISAVVKREQSDAAAFESEAEASLQEREDSFAATVAASQAELDAEERAAEATRVSLQAHEDMQGTIAGRQSEGFAERIAQLRERMVEEETRLAEAESKCTAAIQESERELAEAEGTDAPSNVEHIPGVVLSSKVKADAARCKMAQARLRLAVLRSESSPLGALRAEETELQGRSEEIQQATKRRQSRIKSQRERAAKVLGAKRAAHEALRSALAEQLAEEQEDSAAAVSARRKRVDQLCSTLQDGWNASQEAMAQIINASKDYAKSLVDAGALYTEDGDDKLRKATRRAAMARFSHDVVGLDHTDRDAKDVQAALRRWADLAADIASQQAANQALFDKADELFRGEVAKALEKREVDDLYNAAGQKAAAVSEEEQRQAAADKTEAEASAQAEIEFTAIQTTAQEQVAAARATLEEALRAVAKEEEDLRTLKGRYEEVMHTLDRKLAEAEVRASRNVKELSDAGDGLAKERQETLDALDREEVGWTERTSTRDERRLAVAEENKANIEKVYEEVVAMGKVVDAADEVVKAMELDAAQTMSRRRKESAEAQAHYRAKAMGIQTESDLLLGQPKVEHDKAMAVLEKEMSQRRRAVEEERTAFEEVSKLWSEEEELLKVQIAEMQAAAADVLVVAEAHKQTLATTEQALTAATTELEAQKSKHSQSELENKRALNIFERDALKASKEIDQIDRDVKEEIEYLQEEVQKGIDEREEKAVGLRAAKVAELEERVAAIDERMEKFSQSKREYLEEQVGAVSAGEQVAADQMTEALERVAALAAEREAQRQDDLEEQAQARGVIRRRGREKDSDLAIKYEDEMQTMAEDLEALFAALTKAMEVHKMALEEEQVRERARVEEVTRAELEVELRRRQDEARILFEHEKSRLRKEADDLAEEAEKELLEEEEAALAALRAKRQDRFKVVEEKRRKLRGRLERTFIDTQVAIKEEHIEKEYQKLSLVSRAFGLFGKKRPSSAQKLRDAVQASTDTPDSPANEADEELAWEEKKIMERELAKLEAEMNALQAVADI